MNSTAISRLDCHSMGHAKLRARSATLFNQGIKEFMLVVCRNGSPSPPGEGDSSAVSSPGERGDEGIARRGFDNLTSSLCAPPFGLDERFEFREVSGGKITSIKQALDHGSE